MKMIRILFAALILLFPSIVFSQTTWNVYQSDVSFKIKNAGFTVTGRFDNLKAGIAFNPDHLETSSLKGSVPVSTIKTGIDKRDKDLKKETYFDADKYKTIELSSTKLYKKDNHFAGTFHVTIKGITKQVEIPFTFTQTGKEAEFAGSFTINRRDYGVGGSSIMMSDDLTVSITIKARE